MALELRLVSVDGASVDQPKTHSVASLCDLQAALIKAAYGLDQISARARLVAITLKLTALQAEAAAICGSWGRICEARVRARVNT
jgi:hypothetical protein